MSVALDKIDLFMIFLIIFVGKAFYGLWAIEGDISKCFGQFDHKRLASIIKKKYITLQIFLDLLYKMLNAKIISLKRSFRQKINITLDCDLNFTLLNIYLHELDSFILKGTVLSKFRLNKRMVKNPEFIKLLKLSSSEFLEAKNVQVTKGKKKYWQYLHKLRILKLKKIRNLGIAPFKSKGLSRKIIYVRYDTSFVLFVRGTRKGLF